MKSIACAAICLFLGILPVSAIDIIDHSKKFDFVILVFRKPGGDIDCFLIHGATIMDARDEFQSIKKKLDTEYLDEDKFIYYGAAVHKDGKIRGFKTLRPMKGLNSEIISDDIKKIDDISEEIR